MAIRDHFRRRKSICDPGQGGPNGSESLKSPASRLAKTFGWRPRKEEKPKKTPIKDEKNSNDSRERPLNKTNPRQQDIFNGFTLTFGKDRRQMSREDRLSSYSFNVSPGTSRHNSVEVEESPLRMNPVSRDRQLRTVPREARSS